MDVTRGGQGHKYTRAMGFCARCYEGRYFEHNHRGKIDQQKFLELFANSIQLELCHLTRLVGVFWMLKSDTMVQSRLFGCLHPSIERN